MSRNQEPGIRNQERGVSTQIVNARVVDPVSGRDSAGTIYVGGGATAITLKSSKDGGNTWQTVDVLNAENLLKARRMVEAHDPHADICHRNVA